MGLENLTDDQFENLEVPREILDLLLGSNKINEVTAPQKMGIDYTRPLSDYGTAEHIATFIKESEKDPNYKTQHIYTKSLNVNGIAVQDSMEKYLASEHYGGSTIKEMLKTPFHFAYARSDDKKKLEAAQEEKGAFKLGTFLHQAVLEPTKFDRVAVLPENGAYNSKDGVNNYIDFWEKLIIANNQGYNEKGEPITPSECFAMADAEVVKMGQTKEKMDGLKTYSKTLEILSGITCISAENYYKVQILKKHFHAYAGGLLPRLIKHSKREISMYYTDPETGIDCKIRPDALQFAENIGVDTILSVKSTGCEDLRAFAWRSAELHYDLSEGMYQEAATYVTGRDFRCTITIMLQTVEPFAIAVLVWSPKDIEMGKYKYKTALRDIKNSFDLGIFKGYDSYSQEGNLGLVDFELPYWNNKELLPKT